MGISGSRDESGGGGKVALPTVPLLLTVLAGVWIALATACAGAYSLAKSGYLPLGKILAGSQSSDAAPATHAVVLDSILANLADPGGHAYLRLGITLDVANESSTGGASVATRSSSAKVAKTISAADSSLRDTILTIVGQQTSEALLAPDGKTNLKRLLKDAIAKSNPQPEVNDLYFTDFLVQR